MVKIMVVKVPSLNNIDDKGWGIGCGMQTEIQPPK